MPRIPSKTSVRIRYSEDAGALVFDFMGLAAEHITRLNCDRFVKRTSNPFLQIIGHRIEPPEIFRIRKQLVDALDLLEKAWVLSKPMDAAAAHASKAGRACFNSLVGLRPGNPRLPPDIRNSYNLPKLLTELFTQVASSEGEPHVLEIEGKPAADVPWQAMPLVELPYLVMDPTSPFEGFLGTHYVIQRLGLARSGAVSLNIENSSTPVRMKFFQNRTLKACDVESGYLDRLVAENQLDMQGTPWPKDNRGAHEYVRLANDHKTIVEFDGSIGEGEPDHVHHYSCHHEFKAPDVGLSPQSTISLQADEFTGELPVSVEEIVAELQNAITGCQLGFLNACQTGRDADIENELSGIRGWMLRCLGFTAVIASETTIRDSSSGELSISFYRHFFGGEDSAHALFRAIREAAKRGDPTCLLFAMHGDGRVRLRKTFEMTA